MDKGIVLVSGGLDSTLAIVECAKDSRVTPIFVNYGQYAYKREKKAIKAVVSKAGAGFPYQIDLQMNPHHGDCGPEQIGSVWNRTMALVGIASMWAYVNGNDYKYIAVGSHKGDVGPDIKPGRYDVNLQESLLVGTKDQIDLRLPIRDLTTEDIGIALDKAGISFNSMYSCYWDPPCGFKSTKEDYRCPGCRRKTIAMQAAGEMSSALLNFPNGNLKGRTYQSELAEELTY